MSRWWQEARTGAAREFGARHYKAFAGAEALSRLRVPIVVVVLAGGGLLAWRAAAHAATRTSIDAPAAPHLPWAWIAAGAVLIAVVLVARARLLAPVLVLAVAGGAVWLTWWAVTHLSLPWRAIGITAAILAVAAAAALRMFIPLAVLAVAGGLVWLAWHAVTAWSLPWPWLAVAAVLAVAARQLLRRHGGLLLRLPGIAGHPDTGPDAEPFDILS